MDVPPGAPSVSNCVFSLGVFLRSVEMEHTESLHEVDLGPMAFLRGAPTEEAPEATDGGEANGGEGDDDDEKEPS